jgi:repressor LexA
MFDLSVLTKAQRRTLDFIVTYVSSNHIAPTAQEIAEGTGISSRGVVYRYLKALQVAGFIDLNQGRHRNIVLRYRAQPSASQHISILGRIAAGKPIEAIEDERSWGVSEWSQGGCFALRVAGDSMKEVGILDGDLVVLRESATAENGSIVVALVDQNEATLKRFYDCGAHVELRAENSQHKTMKLSSERVNIQGVLVGVVRSFV